MSMLLPEIINAGFIGFSGIFTFYNLKTLLVSKSVAGVSISSQVFATVWCYWSLYWYYLGDHWLSMGLEVLPCIAGTAWCAFAIYYTRKNKK